MLAMYIQLHNIISNIHRSLLYNFISDLLSIGELVLSMYTTFKNISDLIYTHLWRTHVFSVVLPAGMLSRHSIQHLRQVTRRVTQMTRCVTHVFTRQTSSAGVTAASQKVFDREDKYGAHNYAPVPVALTRAEGE